MTNDELKALADELEARTKAARQATVAKVKASLTKGIHQTYGLVIGGIVVYALCAFHLLPTL
jgi:hypothetical protein